MKFVHLLPVFGIAAALGATGHLSSHRGSAALSAPAALASVVPPWLTGALPDEATDDPHAATHADPHAEVPAGYHLHEDGTLHADGSEDAPSGPMPDDAIHAGVMAGDPHAEESAIENEADPYARIGLEPPREVNVPADLARSAAANGRRVAEVYAQRSTLNGQRVSVRGTVVKVVEGVLGKTYLHLKDGSGNAEAGDDDLTATSTESFDVGETVEVEGQLAIDRDVGAGYVYSALLDDVRRTGR